MNWYLKRVLNAVGVIVLVANFTFLLLHQLPGGPVAYLLSKAARGSGVIDQQELIALAEAYLNVNPEAPLHEQYINYFSALLHGDFGTSILYGQPVTDLLLSALPWTIFLFSLSLSLTFSIGILLGAVMAYYEGSKFDVTASIYSIFSTSIPYYVVGLIALFYLGFQWGIFPTTGRYDDTTTIGLNIPFLIGVLQHAALPVLSIVLSGFGGWALGMRGNSIQELGKNYLRVAQLRGLSDVRIATRYIGRNAILPLYTSLMISIGGIIGGSVILETIFTYRGVGYYLFKAISARDYPLMMGAFLLITTGVVVGILIADLTYGLLDPRASQQNIRNHTSSGKLLSRARIRQLRGKLFQVISFQRSSPQTNHTTFDSKPDNKSILDDSETNHKSLPKKNRFSQQLDEFVLTPVRILMSDWRARLGTAIIVAIIFMGTVGVVLVPEPSSNIAHQYIQPFTTPQYPLGTTKAGAGVFAKIVHATPQILKMVIAGAVFAIIVGSLVGIIAGYVGGIVDRILMTLADILLTLPGLPLVIVLLFFIDISNPYIIGVILAINNWSGLARAVRSQVLTLRDAEYVEASRYMGVSTLSIAYADILPNLMPYIAINFVQAARRIIFESVALYFLGILASGTANWGVMMNLAYTTGGALYAPTSFHWLLYPMLTVVLFSLGAVLLAQGADRVFNPRVRARHAKTSVSDSLSDEEGSSINRPTETSD